MCWLQKNIKELGQEAAKDTGNSYGNVKQFLLDWVKPKTTVYINFKALRALNQGFMSFYTCALCTAVSQRIKLKDPHAAAECERLEECATQSVANHDCIGCCRKAPLYAGQAVSVINNDRTLAPCHCIICSQSWLLLHQSHWWS